MDSSAPIDRYRTGYPAVEAALAVLAAVRQAGLGRLESLSEVERERAGSHSESGPCGVHDWLRIYAARPHEHAQQIGRALSWS